MTDQLTHDAGPDKEDTETAASKRARLIDSLESTGTPRRKHRFLWIWIAGGALIIAVVAALTLLIAPGTTVAGVPVGALPPSVAANLVSQRLADATISVNGTTMTGRELGVQADATAVTNRALAERPLWNFGAWFGKPIAAPVTLNTGKADKALQRAFPALYEKPKDATVTFANGQYVAAPAAPGIRVDTAALAQALTNSFTGGLDHLAVRATKTEALPAISTDTATATASKLNTMLATIGFYVGTERTVPIAPDVASSWLKVTPQDSKGEFSIVADQKKIQSAVAALPGQVNRQPTNAQNIVNAAGTVLRTETVGATGRTLGDTSGVASAFAIQLSKGKAEYRLPVTETPFQTTNLQRSIQVDLGTQSLSMVQNGAIVGSWAISSGLPGTPTPTGHFTVRDHIRVQTMSSTQYGYVVPDVQWVMYFDYNGDAFHGVYWHDNFGHPMSHGCVGMPISLAEQLYNWTPDGTDVYIH